MKFDNKDINYWFTGDTHYWHKNIVKGESSWSDKSGCRDFKDRREMSTHIVDQINKHVMPDDVLFHVGDWSFGGLQNVWNFRKRLNVKKIFLTTGNHDHHLKKQKEIEVPKTDLLLLKRLIKGFSLKGESNLLYCVEEKEDCFVVPITNLFSNVQPLYEIQIHGHRMTLCHYAMRTWYFHNKGSFNLHGHSHSSLPPIGKQLDVGIDEAFKRFGEYRPFKFQEIQQIMSNKEFQQVDSHNPKTNP